MEWWWVIWGAITLSTTLAATKKQRGGLFAFPFNKKLSPEDAAKLELTPADGGQMNQWLTDDGRFRVILDERKVQIKFADGSAGFPDRKRNRTSYETSDLRTGHFTFDGQYFWLSSNPAFMVLLDKETRQTLLEIESFNLTTEALEFKSRNLSTDLGKGLALARHFSQCDLKEAARSILANENETMKGYALKALVGKELDTGLKAHVRPYLHHKDAEKVREAVKLLGAESIPALEQNFDLNHVPMVSPVLTSLPEGREYLYKQLQKPAIDTAHAISLIRALRGAKAGAPAGRIADTACKLNHPEIFLTALDVLAPLGHEDEAYNRVLRKALQTPGSHVEDAHRLVEKAGLSEARALYRDLLEQANMEPSMTAHAIRHLGRYQDRTAVPAIIEAGRQGSSEVVEAAVDALNTIGVSEILPFMVEVLTSGPKKARQKAAHAVGRWGNIGHVENLKNAMTGADRDLRKTIEEAVANLQKSVGPDAEGRLSLTPTDETKGALSISGTGTGGELSPAED
ncbi:MAG: HEAT repeat domain-containing protein [Acidobacteriota bacterium]|nr:HEAT repeat domain-containing protein [Acidobacteriota bacterium]